MANKEINENYVHSCGCGAVTLRNYVSPISDAGYTSDEFQRIIDFYLFHAPVLKSDQKDNFGLKHLRDYGWVGNVGMTKLERELLKVSHIPMFCFIRSTSIKDTLEQMKLSDEICAEHPRAVLLQEFKTTVSENEIVKISNHETRMECLFRHIRNSLAHNRTYVFENGLIMLEDCDESKSKITARILINKNTLLDWIDVITKQEKTASNNEIK